MEAEEIGCYLGIANYQTTKPCMKTAYFLHEKLFEKSWGKLLVEWGKIAIFVCFSYLFWGMVLNTWELATNIKLCVKS